MGREEIMLDILLSPDEGGKAKITPRSTMQNYDRPFSDVMVTRLP